MVHLQFKHVNIYKERSRKAGDRQSLDVPLDPSDGLFSETDLR